MSFDLSALQADEEKELPSTRALPWLVFTPLDYLREECQAFRLKA